MRRKTRAGGPAGGTDTAGAPQTLALFVLTPAPFEPHLILTQGDESTVRWELKIAEKLSVRY